MEGVSLGVAGPFGVPQIAAPQISAPTIDLARFNFTDGFQQSLNNLPARNDAFSNLFGFNQQLLSDLPAFEFNQFRDFFNLADPFLQGAISNENAFNQQQFSNQIDQAAPGSRAALQANLNLASNFAQGRFSDNVLNSAFEVNSRGQAADALNRAGFGDNTIFTDDLNDRFSVERRLGLQQFGIGQTQQTAQNNIATLTSQPARLNTASAFNPTLSFSPGQALINQTNTRFASDVLSAPQNVANTIQQRQFRTSQVQGVNNNQAQLDFSAEQANAQFDFNAQVANASNALQTQQLNNTNALNELAIASNAQQVADANAAALQGANSIASGLNTQALAAGGLAAIDAFGGIDGIIDGIGSLFESDTAEPADTSDPFDTGLGISDVPSIDLPSAGSGASAPTPSSVSQGTSLGSDPFGTGLSARSFVQAQAPVDSFTQSRDVLAGLENTPAADFGLTTNRTAGSDIRAELRQAESQLEPDSPEARSLRSLTDANVWQGQNSLGEAQPALLFQSDSTSRAQPINNTQDAISTSDISEPTEAPPSLPARILESPSSVNTEVRAQVVNQIPDEVLGAEVGMDFTMPESFSEEDLANGLNTFNWAQKELKAFGLQGDSFDNQQKAVVGDLIFRTVRDWNDMKPSARVQAMAMTQKSYLDLVKV